MCVLAYSRRGAKPLSKQVVEAMWNTNPDGAGIAWVDGGKVNFIKGYFNFETFYKDYRDISNSGYECAIHMRIATSGGVNDKMCHPFVVTKNEKRLVKTSGRADTVLFHNGVLKIAHRPNFSDTAEYTLNDIYPRYKHDKRFYKHLTNKQRAEIETEIAGSRILLLGADGAERFGKGWKEYQDGTWVSNTNFEWRLNYGRYTRVNKPIKSSNNMTYMGNGAWADYDDDYDDYWSKYDNEYTYNKYDAFDDYYRKLMG